MNKKRIVFVTFFIGLVVPIALSYSQARVITKNQLIQDMDFFIRLIDQSHSNPYQIHSGKEFINKSRELKELPVARPLKCP